MPGQHSSSSQGGHSTRSFGKSKFKGSSFHSDKSAGHSGPRRFGVSKGGRPYNRTSGGYKPGGYKGGYSGGNRKEKFKHQEFRDISRFINKAVITESTEHF